MPKWLLIIVSTEIVGLWWLWSGTVLADDCVVLRPGFREDRLPANSLRDAGFERAGTPQSDWQPFERGFVVDRDVRCEGTQSIRCHADDTRSAQGATATFVPNQKRIAPVRIAVRSKCVDVPSAPSGGYCIWVDIIHTDGTPTWGLSRFFSTGTHDWERQTLTIMPVKPIARMHVHCLFRWVKGTAWFDDAAVWFLDDVKVGIFDGEPVEVADTLSVSSTRSADSLSIAKPGTGLSTFARAGDLLEVAGDAGSGQIDRIVAGGQPLSERLLPGGILIQDAGRRGDIYRVIGPVRVQGGTAIQKGTVAALDLEVATTWRSKNDHITGHIEITGRRPVERALSVVAAFPVRAVGWTWHDDVRRSRRIESGSTYENTARLDVGKTGNSSMYPLAAITNERIGLGLAVPLDEPRVFRLAYDAEHRWLYAAFDMAISPEPVTWSNRVSAAFELFTFDATWGFRAALDRYYTLHSASFVKRVKDIGLWMAFAKISQVEQAEDFGFYFKEGLGDEAYDNAHGILTFRYTEPQSHWLPMPKGMKRSYDEAIKLLKQRSQEGDAASRRPHLAALACGAMTAAGQYHVGLYDTPWCDGAVFALNPSPSIPGETTKAKINYDPAEAAKLYADDPHHGVDGEYLDSLDGWSQELNYRREHMKWVEVPLVYDTEGRRPCIINAFSIWEYVRWMSNQVHARGKLMMANYTPTKYPWQVPHLDLMGQETNWNPGGRWEPMSDADLCYRRSLCASKPYLFLQNSDFNAWTVQHTRWYMMRAGAYGMQPSFFSVDAANNHYFQNPSWYDRDRPVFRQLIPIIRRIGRAGWRPITSAKVEPAPLQIERFGEPGTGEVFLTVHNPAETDVCGRLVLDAGLDAKGARELVSGRSLAVRTDGGAAIELFVSGRETLFIELTSK